MFRPISIEAVANGWVVAVGCQKFVFTSAADLTNTLHRYLKDPEGTEKRVLATAVNVQHTYSNRLPPPQFDSLGRDTDGAPPSYASARGPDADCGTSTSSEHRTSNADRRLLREGVTTASYRDPSMAPNP